MYKALEFDSPALEEVKNHDPRCEGEGQGDASLAKEHQRWAANHCQRPVGQGEVRRGTGSFSQPEMGPSLPTCDLGLTVFRAVRE